MSIDLTIRGNLGQNITLKKSNVQTAKMPPF